MDGLLFVTVTRKMAHACMKPFGDRLQSLETAVCFRGFVDKKQPIMDKSV